MPTQDIELLTLSRCRRLLEPLSVSARQRIVAYLQTLALDIPPPKAKVDPRQTSLPTEPAESPFDAQ